MLIGGRDDCCGLRRVVEPIVDVLFFVFLFVVDVKCAKDFAENVLVYVPVLTEVRSIIWRTLETLFVDLFVLEVLVADLVLFDTNVKCERDFAESVLVYVQVLTEVRSIILRIVKELFVDLFVLKVLFAYLDFVAGRLIGHFAWTPSSSLFVEEVRGEESPSSLLWFEWHHSSLFLFLCFLGLGNTPHPAPHPFSFLCFVCHGFRSFLCSLPAVGRQTAGGGTSG